MIATNLMAVALRLFLIVLVLVASSCGECGNEERLALLAFRDGISFDPHGILQHWDNNPDQNPCEWPGITCSQDGRVTSLILENLSLEGRIAPEIAKLQLLSNLDFSGNDLSGSIPSELGAIVNLENLDLANNHLTGAIPHEIYNLVKIKHLRLNDNHLAGYPEVYCHSRLPDCGFCNFRHLQTLDISHNILEGDLPSCILLVPSHRFENNCFHSVVGQKSQDDCGADPYRRLLKQENNTTSTSHHHHHHHHTGRQDNLTKPLAAPQKANHTTGNKTQHSVPPRIHRKPAMLKHHEKRRKQHPVLTGFLIALPVAAVGLVILVASICIYKRRTAAVSPWKTGMSGHLQKTLATDVPALRLTEIQSACEEFSNIIGSSPDSTVYKGTLTNGVEVAVTNIRISAASWTASSEIFFRRKVEALARMKHTHLVNLMGVCAEDDPFARMLLFEYAPNGTLFEHLHNSDVEHLDWSTRMRAVMGAAFGLEYMHHDLLPPASHSNFDSTAIYLTEDYAAKIADYGFTKLAVIKCDKRKSFSNAIGYDDLEGSDRLAPDFESNIFSFGIFLLEVITGRLPYSDKEGSLLQWAMQFLNTPERISDMVDPSLKNVDLEQLLSVCDVVRLCINTDASKRPTMRHITSLLAKDLKMSRATAQPRPSPLLWAELEILATE